MWHAEGLRCNSAIQSQNCCRSNGPGCWIYHVVFVHSCDYGAVPAEEIQQIWPGIELCDGHHIHESHFWAMVKTLIRLLCSGTAGFSASTPQAVRSNDPSPGSISQGVPSHLQTGTDRADFMRFLNGQVVLESSPCMPIITFSKVPLEEVQRRGLAPRCSVCIAIAASA